jgi:hypothetical protein
MTAACPGCACARNARTGSAGAAGAAAVTGGGVQAESNMKNTDVTRPPFGSMAPERRAKFIVILSPSAFMSQPPLHPSSRLWFVALTRMPTFEPTAFVARSRFAYRCEFNLFANVFLSCMALTTSSLIIIRSVYKKFKRGVACNEHPLLLLDYRLRMSFLASST